MTPVSALQGNAHFCGTCKKIANKILDIALKILLFPIRYFGSKLLSGYHFFKRENLEREELFKRMDLICSTAFVHGGKSEWMEPFGYKPDSLFFDPKSGLKASVLNNDKRVIIAFGAKGSSKSEMAERTKKINKLIVDHSVKNWLGYVPDIYEQADQFFHDVMEVPDFQGKEVVLTGQCFGGSLASYVALKNEKEAFCLNSLPLGAGLQQRIGRKKLKKASQNITQLTVKGDWMTDCAGIIPLDLIFSVLGIRTPGNFGRRVAIPSAYPTRGASHDFIVGSAMKHLGYCERTKPEEILKAAPTSHSGA